MKNARRGQVPLLNFHEPRTLLIYLNTNLKKIEMQTLHFNFFQIRVQINLFLLTEQVQSVFCVICVNLPHFDFLAALSVNFLYWKEMFA